MGRELALAVSVAGLAALAWAALWLWSASPYARYLAHGGWLDAAALAALCRAIPQGERVVPAALHALAWVLMIAAMMLPTTWPLLALFRRLTHARADRSRLVALVAAGYFVSWLAFGVVAHAADTAVLAGASRSGWLLAHGWVVGAGVLAAAGAFQFSSIKYRCLERCASPFAFVTSRWHGRSPAREALSIGIAHGAFCVGCCWALMLVMFVVGTGNLAWMVALAAVMAAEKNLPFGRRLSAPLGIALLLAAASIVVANA